MNVTYEDGAFVVRRFPLILTISRVNDIGNLEDVLSVEEVAEAKARIRQLFARGGIPLTVFTKAVADYAGVGA